jgi:hypothetical protein
LASLIVGNATPLSLPEIARGGHLCEPRFSIRPLPEYADYTDAELGARPSSA